MFDVEGLTYSLSYPTHLVFKGGSKGVSGWKLPPAPIISYSLSPRSSLLWVRGGGGSCWCRGENRQIISLVTFKGNFFFPEYKIFEPCITLIFLTTRT